METQNKILENLYQTGTKENQFLILQPQLAKFETMMDSFSVELISQMSAKNTNAPELNTQNDFPIAIIESLKDLDKLEEDLEDKHAMGELTEKLSYICGRKGNANGLNSCYLLVDRLFSRKFMTLCSWAGGARGQKEKILFKMYKRIIHLFFKVVQLSDRNFT